MSENQELLELFKTKLSFGEDLRKEISKNDNLIKNCKSLTDRISNDLPWSKGSLIYEVALALTKNQLQSSEQIPVLVDYVVQDKLKSRDQMLAAIDFLKKLKGSEFDLKKFDFECGVGVTVTDDDMDYGINQLLDKHKETIQQKGKKALGVLLKELRDDPILKWGNIKLMKDKVTDALDKALVDYVPPAAGPKLDKKQKSQKSQESIQSPAVVVASSHVDEKEFFFRGDLGNLHKAGENPQIKPELMEQHLKETGGIVKTRFPPEPNGHLHIGHAKAINVNFGYAKAHGGTCYLRYDDTNPEAEEGVYFESILNSVQWLGFTPNKITYSSDYFQKLYDLAVEMIKKDKAYACHCTGEEIHKQRGGEEKGARYDCPHRYRPIKESLQVFEDMKNGKYKEGEAIIRMKMDNQNPNPQFWDLVAYRVLYHPHYRTGKDWCIYPTYDYTHCLCDSFENITHSMCTTEFTASRPSYYWLCDVLEVYKPVQWEYGRLNLTNTVLSKRKLTKLVQDGIVSGWDDPRIYTLVALKRRGFPPEAINQFVRDVGVSTAQSTISVKRLEFFVRQHLDDHCTRLMCVQRPVTLLIVNLPEEHYEELEMPLMPKIKGIDLGSRKMPFTNTVYIDGSDFNDTTDVDQYRLRKHGSIGLMMVNQPILCLDKVEVDGKPVLKCLYMDPETIKDVESNPGKYSLPAGFKYQKPKTYIQWIGLSLPSQDKPNKMVSPQKAEFRLYNQLFMHENPMDKSVVKSWLDDINPDSLVTTQGFVESCVGFSQAHEDAAYGKLENGKLHMNVESKFQAMRVGFFAVDRDSKVAKQSVEFQKPIYENDQIIMTKIKAEVPVGWVFNRTVTLREDSKKEEANKKYGNGI